MTLTVRLPLRVAEELADYCVATDKSKSEVVVELIERHLEGHAKRGGRPYESARALGLIGCYAGAPPSKGTYKERVKRAIRAKHAR
jgi:hypothetical protein